jgi:hypothetical protein
MNDAIFEQANGWSGPDTIGTLGFMPGFAMVGL